MGQQTNIKAAIAILLLVCVCVVLTTAMLKELGNRRLAHRLGTSLADISHEITFERGFVVNDTVDIALSSHFKYESDVAKNQFIQTLDSQFLAIYCAELENASPPFLLHVFVHDRSMKLSCEVFLMDRILTKTACSSFE